MEKLFKIQAVVSNAVADSYVAGEFNSVVLYGNLIVGAYCINNNIDMTDEEAFDSVIIMTKILEEDLIEEIFNSSTYKLMEKAAEKQIEYDMSFIRQFNKLIKMARDVEDLMEKSGGTLKDLNLDKLMKEIMENSDGELLQVINGLIKSNIQA